MSPLSSFSVAFALLAALADCQESLLINQPTLTCKNIPGDAGWPSAADFAQLNNDVDGRLSTPHPAGQVCYPGAELNAAECLVAIANAANETYVSTDPLGFMFPPITYSCPPIPVAQANDEFCTYTDFPRYIIEATEASDVQAGVNFASQYNIRLVVKATGHSLSLGSYGPNSLMISTHTMRSGIQFQSTFGSTDCCSLSGWTGAAMTYSAGYTWSDLYTVATENNVIVVGGGDPTVSASGGYIQGGGHSPASQKFGLAAAQVLEYQVVLANGELVTASPCTNSDLYAALRGGGGGTYGIVTSVTIKAFPEEAVSVMVLEVIPMDTSSATTQDFVSAINMLYAAVPGLTDAGVAGAAAWQVDAPAPFIAGSTSLTGFQGAFLMFNTTTALNAAFAPLLAQLKPLQSTLEVVTEPIPFPSYSSYYSEVGISSTPPSAVGSGSALASRLLDRNALIGNPTGLANMINTLIGQPGDHCQVDMEIVAGGAVSTTSPELTVSPGWTTALVHNIISRPFNNGATAAQVEALRDDLTYNRNAAQEAQSPNTGAYMNEGDFNDPNFQVNFWGANAAGLVATKSKYDPNHLFYCNVCIDSASSTTDGFGRLCRVS